MMYKIPIVLYIDNVYDGNYSIHEIDSNSNHILATYSRDLLIYMKHIGIPYTMQYGYEHSRRIYDIQSLYIPIRISLDGIHNSNIYIRYMCMNDGKISYICEKL